MKRYQEGRYEEALREFRTAYALRPFPRVLYNMGRAEYQLGHPREALDLYRHYLELEPEPPRDYRARVDESIAEAEALLDARQRRAAQEQKPQQLAPPAPKAGAVKTPDRRGKAGPFMLNVRFGPAVPLVVGNGISNMSLTQFPTELAFGLEAGVALGAGRSAYLTLPLQFQFEMQSGTLTTAWIVVPLAFQYDIAIPAAPGLYLYPRLTAGYTAAITPNGTTGTTAHMGAVIPEFGLKYVLLRRVNFGLEPLGLPVFFNDKSALLFYRLMAYVGVNL